MLAEAQIAVKEDAERVLARALARGDADAALAFYREHFDVVYAFVFHRVGGDVADAEDVTQETFLTALRQAGSFDGRSTLRTWLLGVARNMALVNRRERGARARRAAELARAVADLDVAELPDALACADETVQLVGAALACLPEHYRRALVDKYVGGKSVAELAARERRSEKAMESTLGRARRAFADELRALARTREEP